MSKKTRIIVIVLVVLFLPTLVWLGGTALYQLKRAPWATASNVMDQRLYAAHDTLYSVLRLTDEDGSVVEQYSYSPYGADPTDPRSSLLFVYCEYLMRV